MSSAHVRDATLADAPAIGAVSVSAQRATYAGVMTPAYLEGLREAEEAARWRDVLARDPRVLVAEAAGEVIGFARWDESIDDEAQPGIGELRDIFVHPSAWRRGSGSLLLSAVVARLQAAGFRAASLWVVHGNLRARDFYEARGWRTDGAQQRHDRFRSGAVVHVVRYCRTL